jgi:hypothetical protein
MRNPPKPAIHLARVRGIEKRRRFGLVAGEARVPAIAEDRVVRTRDRAAMAGTYVMIDAPTFCESRY